MKFLEHTFLLGLLIQLKKDGEVSIEDGDREMLERLIKGLKRN